MSPAMMLECTTSCQSQFHGDLIIAAIIQGSDDEAITYMQTVCHRSYSVRDQTGKTALHTAASCGKSRIIQWLLAKGADINEQDAESGYTALHRAIYYGHIHIAHMLIEKGANDCIRDAEGLCPFDLLYSNQPEWNVAQVDGLSLQLYVWGINSNFNLGQFKEQSLDAPECLHAFSRECNGIKQCCINKYHSIFLGSNGIAYSCGLGQGGRLGLGIDKAVVIPYPIKTFNSLVKMVAIGVDHSIFLTETNQVWACGSNTFHQLGLSPPPVCVLQPRLLNMTSNVLKNLNIIGVGAAKYHSLFWSQTSMFTFGLNGGQLGHIRSEQEKTIVIPRKVTSIPPIDNVEIISVGVSNGAIVICFTGGYISVLSQYQIRCISSRTEDIVKVACIGGNLDRHIGEADASEKVKSSLHIAALDKKGHLYIWTEDTLQLTLCYFLPMKEIYLSDFCLHQNGYCLVTKNYEAFAGTLCEPEKLYASIKKGSKSAKQTFLQRMMLSRLPGLHRVISILCDPKGTNFAAFQFRETQFVNFNTYVGPSKQRDMLARHYHNATEYDGISDVVFIVDGERFAAHSYIIAQHSSTLAQKLVSKIINKRKEEKNRKFSNNQVTIELNFNPKFFREFLNFMYYENCKFIIPGQCDLLLHKNIYPHYNNLKDEDIFNMDPIKSKRNKDIVNNNNSMEIVNSRKQSENALNIYDTVRNLAKKLGITELEKQMKTCKFSDGFISVTASSVLTKPYAQPFKRSHHPELYNVQFVCKDGTILGAHKCILVATSDYFEAMFAYTWIETIKSEAIKMPICSKLLKIILDYLYEDDSSVVRSSTDLHFLCDMLAMAHQFLIHRLQEICENSLASLINFRNSVELLKFAYCFTAKELIKTIFEFICLNMPAYFEMGSLSFLDEEAIKDISEAYRQVVFGIDLEPCPINYLNDEKPHLASEADFDQELEDSTTIESHSSITSYYPKSVRMALRIFLPPSGSPSKEELKIVLKENPSIVNETEKNWLQRSKNNFEKSQPTPGIRGNKKYLKDLNTSYRRRRFSSSSSGMSTSSDGEIPAKDNEEPFSFSDLCEREVPPSTSTPATDLWITVGKSPSEKKKNHVLPTAESSEVKDSITSESIVHLGKSPPDIQCQLNELPLREQYPEDSKINIIKMHSVETLITPRIEAPSTEDTALFPLILEAVGTRPQKTRRKRMAKFPSKSQRKISVEETQQHLSSSPQFAWGFSLEDTTNQEPGSHFSLSTTVEPFDLFSFCRHDEDEINHNKKETKGWSLPPSYPTKMKENNIISASLGSITEFSFVNILEKEKRESVSIKKHMSKPLHLIQLEDRAMSELLEFYGGKYNPEENVCVVRINDVTLQPRWTN